MGASTLCGDEFGSKCEFFIPKLLSWPGKNFPEVWVTTLLDHGKLEDGKETPSSATCFHQGLPFGKHAKNFGTSPFSTGKSAINGHFQ